MAILTIKTPEALDARLSAIARKRGQSKSAVARAALEAYLAGAGEPVSGSCLELSHDLAGKYSGPADLSVNSRRLEGFGQ